ncbi:DUF4124 domain-containing protein [Halomonas sp. BC04]|uniref:DUF4124 domain-containing protein n=1 Tax=Halomonas sp. BC04 TaxID=1403540 RepID=UPI0003ED70AF|nr:DUF4124 domain-containing protein [Halomonas sp. BC04]EWH00469.1 hypothetical protein Q427_19395 [Halomonas sp. BC04]
MKVILLLLAILPLAATADIQKCKYQGRTVYQDEPCPEGTEVPFDASGLYITSLSPAQPDADAATQAEEAEDSPVIISSADPE